MSSTLAPDEVERIAHLARLSLTAEERDLYARQLTAVLQYAEQLREVAPPEDYQRAIAVAAALLAEAKRTAGVPARPVQGPAASAWLNAARQEGLRS